MDILLGLDLGTSNCKALAMTTAGPVLAIASAPTPFLPVDVSVVGAAPELDADVIWHLCIQLIRDVQAQVRDQIPQARFIGLSAASLAESVVLVDADGNPTTPVIIWHDLRTLPWLAWWRQHLTPLEIYQRTGLSFDHIYSACKLQWTRQHRPAAFAQTTAFLGLADWITFKLCDVLGMSWTMASRTMLFDPSAHAWSADLFALADIPMRLAPPLMPSGTVVGKLTARAAQQTGLPIGMLVSAGGHDHVCGALAAGVVEPGSMLDSAGTAEAFMVTLDQPALNVAEPPGLGCGCHVARGRYYLIGGILGGGAVTWLAETLNVSADALPQLMAAAAQSPIGANGVWFLPYLRGSGPPKRDPQAFGAWIGFRLKSTRADLVRAALEGLSFGFRKVVGGMQTLAGIQVNEIRAVGGSTHNAVWQQIKADVLGLPIVVPEVAEAVAQGAALLAGIGAGVYADERDAANQVQGKVTRYVPDAARHDAYTQLYQRWSQLYPALESLII